MRMIVVSNRLPVVLEKVQDTWTLRRGSGGLISAIGPILRRYGGLWIGWPGSSEIDDAEVIRLLSLNDTDEGYRLLPVALTPDEVTGFYTGFSNEIIWPLFHDLQSRCNFEPGYWTTYQNVVTKFAQAVALAAQPTDFLWIQDYHLIGLGHRLRDAGFSNKLSFFLHIPFPPPDIFCKLPWRTDVLEDLLQHDVVGFQTPHDVENFTDCIRTLLPKARRRRKQGMMNFHHNGRSTLVGAFPIGIDFDEYGHAAAGPDVTALASKLRAEVQEQQIILGIDRLDYTKGIPYRLRAFHLALKRYPELHRRVVLMQVVVPSRETVPEYQDLKGQIERLVTQINGEFTQPGWVPIHHVFRNLDHEELLAYYRMADVALLTPLKDGMNLVAKEYCACQVDGNGVLILSEFAGAAVQMRGQAILVNPYDLDRVADAIRDAVTLPRTRRRPIMKRLKKLVKQYDVYWWVNRVLEASGLGEELLQGSVTRSIPRIDATASKPESFVNS